MANPKTPQGQESNNPSAEGADAAIPVEAGLEGAPAQNQGDQPNPQSDGQAPQPQAGGDGTPFPIPGGDVQGGMQDDQIKLTQVNPDARPESSEMEAADLGTQRTIETQQDEFLSDERQHSAKEPPRSLKLDMSDHFIDPDSSDSLMFELSSESPSWMSIHPDTGVITAIPREGDLGVKTVKVTATNREGNSASESFQMTFKTVNDIPTVTPIGDGAATEGQGITIDVSNHFSDDGETLTYTLGPGTPSWLSIDGSTGVITGVPQDGGEGIQTVTVIATDPYGASVQDSFDLNVGDLDGSGGNVTFDIDSGMGTISITDFGERGNSGTAGSKVGSYDTLRFQSAGMTADNMLLTQVGSNVHLSFSGIDGFEAILEGATVEGLENFSSNGNFIFYGDSSVADRVDIINANQSISTVWNSNRTSFLNELDNNTAGRTNSDDVINAQGGDDTITGRSGDDILRGESGDDTLLGDEGLSGNLSSTGGDDILEGGTGDDTLVGDAGGSITGGQGGDDILLGGAGNDVMYGDAVLGDGGQGGADLLDGGSGNDYLDGGSGADILYGGSGDDTIVYDASDSIVDGGEGHDTLKIFDASVDLSGFAGVDFEEINLDAALSNSLTIDAQTVLDMSVGNELKITGDSTDSLQLDGTWTQGASADGYTTFTSGEATVQVDDDLVNAGNVTIVP